MKIQKLCENCEGEMKLKFENEVSVAKGVNNYIQIYQCTKCKEIDCKGGLKTIPLIEND